MTNLFVNKVLSVSLPNLLRQAQEPPPRRGAIIRVKYKDNSTMKKEPVIVNNNEMENII